MFEDVCVLFILLNVLPFGTTDVTDTIGLVFMPLVLIPVPGNHCAVFDSATGGDANPSARPTLNTDQLLDTSDHYLFTMDIPASSRQQLHVSVHTGPV